MLNYRLFQFFPESYRLPFYWAIFFLAHLFLLKIFRLITIIFRIIRCLFDNELIPAYIFSANTFARFH